MSSVVKNGYFVVVASGSCVLPSFLGDTVASGGLGVVVRNTHVPFSETEQPRG